VTATLAPVTGFLVAAERARRIELVERIRPDDPGAKFIGNPQHPTGVLSPDSRRQSVRGVVRFRDRFVGGAKRQDGQHRTENLLAGDGVARRDVGENGRAEPEASLWHGAIQRPPFGAFAFAGVHERGYAVQLLFRVDRTDVRVLV
jgi:hypothetical protein